MSVLVTKNSDVDKKTSSKEDALFICHRIPYPPNKGDKIRSWRILQKLRELYNVHLVAFVDDPDDFAHQEFLQTQVSSLILRPLDPSKAKLKSALGFLLGKPLSEIYYRDPVMEEEIAKLRQKKLRVEMVFSSTMAQYIETPPIDDRIRLIDFCDADSEKWAAYSRQKSFPMSFVYGREARLLEQLELTAAAWADASYAISLNEAEVLGRGKRSVEWFANGVDTDYFDPNAAFSADQKSDVIFTGALDYIANVDAVIWFVESVWPLVRAAAPQASFNVVGARPDGALTTLDGVNGIRVIGDVDDVRPWIAGARIAVAPMRVARGIQNKVLEAMAMGRAIVLTPGAALGIEADDNREFLVKSDIVTFADAIIELLSNETHRSLLGAAARERAVTEYSWQKRLARLEDSISAAIARKLSKPDLRQEIQALKDKIDT